jgi:hypothetical protein
MQVISKEWDYECHSDHEEGGEFFSGPSSTLEQLIHNEAAPALYRLSEDLFKALESANAENRWFRDVDEKSILYSKDGRYNLSASGNTISSSVLPDTAIYAGKVYWMPVFAYLIGRVRLPELRPGELPGILFNYLQTMFLILRVRLVFVDQEGYYNSAALFDQLPIILDKLVPEYRALFTQLLTKSDKTPCPSDLKQIKTLFVEKVVLRTNETEAMASLKPAKQAAQEAVNEAAKEAARDAAKQTGQRTTRQTGRVVRPDYLQNGDFLAAVILAVALTFSAWFWSGH